jgi:hypothetical protein
MKKYEIGLINSLDESLEKNGINKDIHNRIMESAGLVKKSTSPIKRAELIFDSMKVMDELLDNKTKQKVREDCACCFSVKQEKLCKQINQTYDTLEEKIKAINETKNRFIHEIKIIEDGRYKIKRFDQSAPICFCLHLLKGINKQWSESWCYCCGGFAKYHLEIILGKRLSVKVISSALTSMGEKMCVFELKEEEQNG